MAIEKNGKWIPVVNNHEIDVYSLKNHKMTKVEYYTKEEAEEQERDIENTINMSE